MQTSLVVFFIVGILFSLLALPLIKGKVKMDAWYGIRTPETMQSESIWYKVNTIMGRYLFLFGIFISLLTLYFALYPLDQEYKMVYLLLGILIVGTVLFIKLSYYYSFKLGEDYQTKAGK